MRSNNKNNKKNKNNVKNFSIESLEPRLLMAADLDSAVKECLESQLYTEVCSDVKNDNKTVDSVLKKDDSSLSFSDLINKNSSFKELEIGKIEKDSGDEYKVTIKSASVESSVNDLKLENVNGQKLENIRSAKVSSEIKFKNVTVKVAEKDGVYTATLKNVDVNDVESKIVVSEAEKSKIDDGIFTFAEKKVKESGDDIEITSSYKGSAIKYDLEFDDDVKNVKFSPVMKAKDSDASKKFDYSNLTLENPSDEIEKISEIFTNNAYFNNFKSSGTSVDIDKFVKELKHYAAALIVANCNPPFFKGVVT